MTVYWTISRPRRLQYVLNYDASMAQSALSKLITQGDQNLLYIEAMYMYLYTDYLYTTIFNYLYNLYYSRL